MNQPGSQERDALRLHVLTLPTGPIEDAEAVLDLLAKCWDDLKGDDYGMTSWKVRRAEEVAWTPPVLSFVIERHGAVALGSVWAELQRWEVNVETGVASCEQDHGRRMVGIRQKRLDVGPLADDVMAKVTGGEDDPRLK